MAGRVIEAKAIISGEDRLSKVLDNVNKKLKGIGKGVKASADLDRLNKSLETTKRQLASIDKISAAQSKLNSTRLGLSGAQARAAEISTALAEARKAKDAAGTLDLSARQKEAQRALAQANSAVERQAAMVREARRELNAFGAPVSNLVAHERALREAVDRTTAAIDRETAALRRKDVQARWDARRAGRQRSVDLADARAAERGTARPGAAIPVPDGRRRHRAPGGGNGEGSLGPLAGLVGTFEAISGYKQAATFDRRLTMIGQTADASRAEIDGLGSSLHRLAQETATPVDRVAGGLESLVAQGRNLKEALDFLPSVTRTAAASGSEVEDIAKTADSVGTNFKIAGKEMQKAFDIMTAGGKAGQFELKDMARYLPSLAPAASAIGMAGEKGLSDTVALLQTIRKGTGTVEEAAASLNNIFQKMESEETTKRFKKMGVDLADAMKKGREEGRNLIEVFEEAALKATKGDLSKLPQLISDQEFARGVRALLTYRNEWQKLSSELQNNSAGTVVRDLVQVTKDAQAAVDRLSNSWLQFMRNASRLADAGGVSKGLGSLGREFEEIAAALERINRAHTEGGLPGVLKQITGDVQDRMREKRGEWLDHYKGKEEGRIAELEADNKRVREKLTREGYSPDAIERTMKAREADVERARRRRGAVDSAQQSLLPKVPLRMGVDPSAPIQGQAGAVGPGVAGFQAAYPIELAQKRPAPRVVPLPPQRPTSLPTTGPAQIDSIHDVLGPGARGPGAAGPATAEVKSPVPVSVSGDVKGTVDVGGTLKVEASPYFTTTFSGFEKRLASVEGRVSSALSNGPGSTGKSSPDAGKGGRD